MTVRRRARAAQLVAGTLAVLLAAVLAVISARYAAQQISSDVRSYRLWINGDLPSWTVPGPYPVLVDLVWWPLRSFEGTNVNPFWVTWWTGPVTVLACLVLWRTARHPRLAVTVWLVGVALLERSYWLRLDAVPALFALVSVVAARRGRVAVSALALSTGALIKVWPIFLIPLVVLALPEGTRLRWGAWFAAPWVAFLALVATLRPPHALDWFFFTFQRRIQIESITALVPMWRKALGDDRYEIFYAKGLDYADLISGPDLQTIHRLIEAVGVVILLALAARTAWFLHGRVPILSRLRLVRRRANGSLPARRDVLRAALLLQTAVLLVVIASGPVFSPQYLAWFAPVIAVAAGERLMRGESVLWWVACALTTLDYPWLFDRLRDGDLVAVQVLTARDAVLAVLLVVCLVRFVIVTRRPRAGSGRAPTWVSHDDAEERDPRVHPDALSDRGPRTSATTAA